MRRAIAGAEMKYKPAIVRAFFLECRLPEPEFEYLFHNERKWRWDVCWPHALVALEVQGGIFVQGRHSRGAALLKEWEKLNTAAAIGWRVLFCQPQDLCLTETARLVGRALQCRVNNL